ncbi:MAG: hypothetical protein Q7U04_07885, partial [Bacteriovorax sp.]|nr:hypothetical protein [Bacteriovorax sp.]
EIIMVGHPKLYENTFFLTDLYVKKKWSIRRISNEIGCSKNTVRKKLIEAGFEVMEHSTDEYKGLEKKIKELRLRSLSYQAIADLFNLWKIKTRSGEGQWHSKTIRDLAHNN